MRRWIATVCAVLTALALGCTGDIVEPGGGGGGNGIGGVDELPAPGTRVPRLSHLQYDNTVRDLFRLTGDESYIDGFRPDPAVTGFIFENNALSLEVDQSLWGAYQRSAADVAAYVTGDAGRLDRILPPAGGDETARADAFIREFGQRAFRRPLTDAEVTGFMAIYQAGRDLYAGVDPFTAGIRLVIDAILQSPHFLYRVESATARSGAVIPLNSYEVATRLSYMLWNTMPDDELFAVAAAGELTDPATVETQVRRMLDDPRAEDVLWDFHRLLFDLFRYEQDVSFSSGVFTEVPGDLGARAAQESELFLRDVFANDGTYTDLLTSPRTFVDSELAAIYGVDGSFDDSFSPVELDPTQRGGLFTQVGFLALYATAVDPDPIHRGKFIAERVACVPIPAPPDTIPMLTAPEGRTNREHIEELTETSQPCIGCHSTAINPFGFPFENYDAVGAWRTEDHGFPVDATASPPIDDQPTEVADGLELVQALAAAPIAHECYVGHLIEYAYGRPGAPQDDALAERLGAESLEDGLSLKELIIGLATSRAYLNRSAEELP